ncbi:Ppx/GppA phosphatase family protein [Amorphoplanes digitatis]|uniref:Exopolyphosphatase/guanosine-5'-triphosphate, 3'-diphosphate pyrophosphatase n=1 Tax=Actinoplanes digitatis TaxID=1868 RepID=A0A7W7MSE2_9ACTN|nr:Ppx/GppA phosphatase family protein [Actinoplanes digitatis]MBB4764662.1 exopolyphosphatase/guanosine-5'-triphosphate,3'-diphosphate pyrophosphatase [Actinoplanes digitatis]
MRLGVLDVGSNTVHLLVVDAHRGGHPTPMHSEKTQLRLAEHVEAGRLTAAGADGLVRAVARAKVSAMNAGCEELLAFATSALRDADNSAAVLARVRAETGIVLQLLSGEDEARYTFLAVRRWYGWSAGRLLVLDIGGGSLELAAGLDEDPEVALSLPLGAGRLTRQRLTEDPPARGDLDLLAADLDAALTPVARQLRRGGQYDLAVGTSKTFRSLAQLAGAAPPGAGLRAPRTLTDSGLHQLFGFISRMASADLAGLDGVSPGRAHQLVAGALVARAAMRALKVSELHICPWALREGAILHRLDTLGVPTPAQRPWPLTDRYPGTRNQPRTATVLGTPAARRR